MDSLTKAALLNTAIHPEKRILQKSMSDSNAIVRRGGSRAAAFDRSGQTARLMYLSMVGPVSPVRCDGSSQ